MGRVLLTLSSERRTIESGAAYVEVVNGFMEGTAFTPQERENLDRQRRLAKIYREGGQPVLKAALEAEKSPTEKQEPQPQAAAPNPAKAP
jgi:hypothetical protein